MSPFIGAGRDSHHFHYLQVAIGAHPFCQPTVRGSMLIGVEAPMGMGRFVGRSGIPYHEWLL